MVLLAWTVVFITVLLVSTGQTQSSCIEQHRYRSTTNKTSELIHWCLQIKDDVHIITAEQDKIVFTNHCNLSGETRYWKMKDPETDLTAERKNNILFLEGKVSGREIKKKFSLDNCPWYQPLTYSLRDFLASDRQVEVFWMIRLDKLEAVKMKAVKKQIEDIELYGRKIKTHFVQVQPKGFLSIFWHGNYWYRYPDGLFVQYQGVNGAPGTPATVIRLSSDVFGS